ncbi:chemotaxis protein MotB [Anaerocolumna xylanovorans DSM 12503]|uniref:Chemotaxis protein MotB n=2 Tax=Anaerocolumna TaxID=1843210 RepID=A0A1M7YE56_9FIRM|nr:chemotaxis protein MotB [Anaerocolumna xylanovorans DSM 12503]
MKKKEKKSENSERWLFTYSDMITLLMIFFIMLYSISNVNQQKYDELAASLSSAFGAGDNAQGGSIIPKGSGILNGGKEALNQGNYNGKGNASGQGDGTGEDIENITEVSKEEFIQLKDWLYDAIGNGEFKDNLDISVQESGIVITLSNDILFDSGQAEIKDDMKKNLDVIAKLLKQVDNKIEIAGHTDNVPINRGVFTSNWQLSVQRAANVVEYLADEYGIAPKRLKASGYGEYDPVASNSTEKGKEKNRRISITILFNNSGVSDDDNAGDSN